MTEWIDWVEWIDGWIRQVHVVQFPSSIGKITLQKRKKLGETDRVQEDEEDKVKIKTE